jgi:hypothetical protein
MKYLIAHISHTNKTHEHVLWWKPESRGYTVCFDKSGRYTAEEAREICHNTENMAVLAEEIEPFVRTTPYYRRSDGTLGKLYDGGPHRPVPNSAEAWEFLIRAKAFPLPPVKVTKPTPIGAKARAIYIDVTKD